MAVLEEPQKKPRTNGNGKHTTECEDMRSTRLLRSLLAELASQRNLLREIVRFHQEWREFFR